MQCELCGKETSRPTRVEVDGVEMYACSSCSGYGKRIRPKKTFYKKSNYKKDFKKDNTKKEEKFVDLVENYGEIIKKAREDKNLTIEELARKLFVKESVLRKVESETFKPFERLTGKLEKFFNIKLTKEYEPVKIEKRSEKGSFTIADLIAIKSKEK